MEPGQRFGYRKPWTATNKPMRPVEVVRKGPHRSNKVRVRWLSGEYEGLEEWVGRVNLVVPWDEAEVFLEDEQKWLAASEVSRETCNEVVAEAVAEVFIALETRLHGEVDIDPAVRAPLLTIENLGETAPWLELSAEELLAKPYSYTDRFGDYVAPFPVAVEVAKLCCQRYSHDVLSRIWAEEDELYQALTAPQDMWSLILENCSREDRERAEKRLKERRPVFDLIREWCGEEATEQFNELLVLRQEVDRLRSLLGETVKWLCDYGHTQKAALLAKEVGQPQKSEDASRQKG